LGKLPQILSSIYTEVQDYQKEGRLSDLREMQDLLHNLDAHTILIRILQHGLTTRSANISKETSSRLHNIQKASSLLLSLMLKNNASTQKSVASDLSTLVKCIGMDMGVSSVLSALFENNLTLSERLSESIIESYFRVINLKGIYLSNLEGYFNFLCNICVVNEVPVTRNQLVVLRILTDIRYKKICLTFVDKKNSSSSSSKDNEDEHKHELLDLNRKKAPRKQ
jgi:hypothetical protein